MTVGNPVNPLTGNKYQDELDAAPLPGPLGLEIRRHYNSAYVADDPPWGRGWRLSYDTRLYRVGKRIQIIQADGRRLVFQAPGEGAATGTVCTSEQLGQGELTLDGDGYRWTWPQLRELRFDAAGFLVRIAPVGGSDSESLRITRDSGGLVREVSDPAGRRMQFDYDASGRLARIDHPLGTWHYRIGNEGQLIEVLAPDGSARRYAYDDVGHRTRMTSITDIDGESRQVIGRWAYDAEGRVIRHVRADGSELKLSYATRDDGDRETTLVDGLGRITRYHATEVGGQWRATEILGPGCDGCGPGNLRMRYDDQGRLLARWSVNGEGRGYRYDEEGRIVEIVRLPAPDREGLRPGVQKAVSPLPGSRAARPSKVPGPGDWLIRYAYADRLSSLPTLIDKPSVVPGRIHRLRFERDERGRPLKISESGFAPVAPRDGGSSGASGVTATRPPGPVVEGERRLERQLSWHYAMVGERSLPVRIDGPLSNGDQTVTEPDPASGLDAVLHFADGSIRRVVERDPAGRPLRTETDDGQRRITETLTLDRHGNWLRRELTGALLDEQRRIRPDTVVTLSERRRFDTAGRELEHEDSAGRRIRKEHDARGRQYQVVDARGYQSRLRRDAEGRVLSAGLYEPGRDEPMRAAYYRHDDNGNLVASILPDGRWMQALVVQGRVVGSIDEDLIRLQVPGPPVDGQANVPGYRDLLDSPGPRGRRGGAVGAVAAGGSSLPDRSRPAPVTPAPVTLQDDFGRRVIEYSPDHGLRTFEYDAADRLTAAIDGTGSAIRFDYDARGRLLRRVDALGSVLVSYHYDGRLEVGADTPVQRRRLSRDGLGRVIETRTAFTALPDRWYAVGRRLDSKSGLVERLDLADGSALVLDRGPVSEGAMITTAHRQAARRDGWAGWEGLEEAARRWLPASIAAWLGSRNRTVIVTDLTHHPFQGLTGFRSGNGVETRRRFDRAGRLSGMTIAGPGGLIDDLTYRYGIGPNITAIERGSDALRAGAPVSGYRYRYDAFGRLRGAGLLEAGPRDLEPRASRGAAGSPGGEMMTPPAGGFPSTEAEFSAIRVLPSLDEEPDPTGPSLQKIRWDRSDQAVQVGQRVQAGQLGQAVQMAQTVQRGASRRDAAGRIIEDERFHYAYSPAGQLAQVNRRVDGRLMARYEHDEGSRRIARTVQDDSDQGVTTHFLWVEGRLAAEIDSGGRIRRQYVYLDHLRRAEPIAVIETDRDGRERIDHVHVDHRGAPFATTGHDGRIRWRAALSPTGLVFANAGTASGTTDADPLLRLPGQYADRETGLFDNGYRTYDPQSGRYLQPDPLGYPDGPDAYLYAGGDPVNRVDPQGLYGVEVHYYMTFFLAISAGHSVDDARRIATAAQYVDDNPLTRPVNENAPLSSIFRNHQQLLRYHFPLSGPDGRTLPEFDTSDVNNNNSPQMVNLWNAAHHPGLSRSSRLTLFGEYLHTLADTYAHRDEWNRPINAWTMGCGIGHGFHGHTPDHTHDGYYYDPTLGRVVVWRREERTLAMERRVYDLLRQESPQGGAGASWEQIEAYLREFNAERQDSRKVGILQRALGDLGIRDVDFRRGQVYSDGRGESQRESLQDEIWRAAIDLNEMPGICLPSERGGACVAY